MAKLADTKHFISGEQSVYVRDSTPRIKCSSNTSRTISHSQTTFYIIVIDKSGYIAFLPFVFCATIFLVMVLEYPFVSSGQF